MFSCRAAHSCCSPCNCIVGFNSKNHVYMLIWKQSFWVLWTSTSHEGLYFAKLAPICRGSRGGRACLQILVFFWERGGTDVGKALSESWKKPISLDLVSPWEIQRALWMTPLSCSFILSVEGQVRSPASVWWYLLSVPGGRCGSAPPGPRHVLQGLPQWCG